ncbi:MAG: hypothetical protein ACJ8FY_07645 [Gemmataceae bacterium]
MISLKQHRHNSWVAVSRPRNGRLGLCLFTALALAVLGCQRDEIQHYKVPKEDTGSEAVTQQTLPTRLLGVIIPHGKRTWFFKLSGPVAAIDEQKEAFDRFISSVHFTDQGDKPVTWKTPEGWTEQPGGNGFRYATLRLASKEGPLEVSVSFLEGEGGSLLGNINRWRGQIGLAEISETKLNEVAKKIELDGQKATLVDMTGPGAPKAGGPMQPPMARSPRQGRNAAPVTFKAPEGWQEKADTMGLGRIVFKVTEGDKTGDAAITPLGGQAGGLLANVNRWRSQLRLGPIDEDQLKKEVSEIELDGKAASYVDLIGPESPERQRTLAVSQQRGARSWFITLKGPYDLVAKQKDAFEGFLKSVHFTAGAGE